MEQKLTRRKFLVSSGIALIGASSASSLFGQIAGSTKPFVVPPESEDDVLARLTLNDFLPHVGEEFKVYSQDGRALRLQLIAAENDCERVKWGSNYAGDLFTLLFETRRTLNFGQDVYEFDHFALGKFQLLLAPVGLTGRRFEAVINRMRE